MINNRSALSEPIAKEPDLMQRMFKINFGMNMLHSPEDTLLFYNVPGNLFENWTDEHYHSLIQRTAKRTGADPAILADKDKRTPEQYEEILKTSAMEQIARIEQFNSSNYLAAFIHISRYCKGMEELEGKENIYKPLEEVHLPENPAREDIVNVPLAATLYFFATHEEILPPEKSCLTEENKAEIIRIFQELDALYREHRAEYQTEQQLLEAYLEFLNPQDPASAHKTMERIAVKRIEQLSSVIPTRHVIPNNKLANELTKDLIGTGEWNLTVAGKGKNAVTALCVLTYEESDNVKLTGKQSFTEYDRNVYNTAVSLYVYGDKSHIITPAMVYRAMVNMTETETPSAQQIEAVMRSLDKMRFIRARVDCTEELRRRGASIDGEQITEGIIDTYLLAAEKIKIKAGGKTIDAYHVFKTPILYEYSRLVNQVLTVSAKLLDIQEGGQRVKNTEQRIAIKGYLLRRIEVMKGDTKQSRRILFDTIHKAAGLEQPKRQEKERIRQYVYTVLDFWKDEGYISGYTPIKEGTAYKGIDIFPT